MSTGVIENNRLIAAFHGVYTDDPSEWTKTNKIYVGSLMYHNYWDWIMPVVEKIEAIENGRYGFTIDPWGIAIIDYKENEKEVVHFQNDDNYPKINQYYQTVVDFIKHYNTLPS